MPLTGKTAEQIAALENQLLERIPTGSSMGSKALQDSLGWEEPLYLAVRKRIIESGRLAIGPGRGGSVRKTLPVTAPPVQPQESAPAVGLDDTYADEEALYAPITKVLRERWVADQPFASVAIEATARGGRRPDGTWSRPDITVAALTSYTYVPGRVLDVITFEIKAWRGLNVTGVYEALSHRRAATQSYLACHVPDEQLASMQDLLDDIAAEGRKHGIGLIIIGDPADFQTWDFREEAERAEPDPGRLNTFIQTQLSQGTRDQILKWFKS